MQRICHVMEVLRIVPGWGGDYASCMYPTGKGFWLSRCDSSRVLGCDPSTGCVETMPRHEREGSPQTQMVLYVLDVRGLYGVGGYGSLTQAPC